MFGFVSRKLLVATTTSTDALIPHYILHRTRTRTTTFRISSPAATIPSTTRSDKESFEPLTVSYLVDSCGLTLEAAKRASKRLQIESVDSVNNVLALFKDFGFTDANISSLVQKRPVLLLADPEEILRPKFELLSSIGGSSDVIVKVVLRCPEILIKNLEKDLVPSLQFLKGMLHTDENVLQVVARCHWLLRFNLPAMLGPNVATLRDAGMPAEMVFVFLRARPTALLTSAARFREIVVKVRRMGLDPGRYSFFEAINVFASINDKTWERKVEVFRKWGWSEEDVVAAFKKQPRCMLQSEKKVEGIMDYLVNEMDLDPLFAARSPNVLMCSLTKRIIPRCALIRHLLVKGVVAREDFKFSSALVSAEAFFLSKYVTRHEKIHPRLIDLYNMYKEGVEPGTTKPF